MKWFQSYLGPFSPLSGISAMYTDLFDVENIELN